jgi:Skp family chaperone for outer membrane proteins
MEGAALNGVGKELLHPIRGECEADMKFQTKSKKALGAKIVFGLCLFVGALSGSVATPARAADAVTIGVLDEAKLGENYTKYQSELKDILNQGGVYQTQLDARPALNEAEGKRYDELVKKTRNPAEETEFQGLVKTGSDRLKDANDLAGKAQRTPDEENRLKSVQSNMKANDNIKLGLEDYFVDLLGKQRDAVSKKYLDLADDAVRKIAVDKKLTIVLRKDAVVWNAPVLDITDEVLSRLNKQ